MKVGILSDTHGLLRPEVLSALQGCEMILHGGDINKQSVLDTLSTIAPFRVVRGNNDKDWAEQIPSFLDFNIGDIRVYMTHKKKDLPDDLSPYDLVIIGHSHKFVLSEINGVMILNPGSCGPRRFDQEITLALADIDGKTISVTRIDIPHQKKA